jgi:hypothetical protein
MAAGGVLMAVSSRAGRAGETDGALGPHLPSAGTIRIRFDGFALDAHLSPARGTPR